MAGFNGAVIATHQMEKAEEISTFWVLIERALRKRKWTPTDLTREGKISWPSLRKYRERGMSPTQRTLERLAAALKVPTSDLVYSPTSEAQIESGRLFRSLMFESGVRMLGELSDLMHVSQERLEECALGTASLSAGEMRRLVEIIHSRNRVPPQNPTDAGGSGGPVERVDVDRMLDRAEAAMDENDRVALAVLLRNRDVKQLLGELQELASNDSQPKVRS